MKRLIYGVGLNDADYTVSPVINGKQVRCPFYVTWLGILERCYYPPKQQIKPSYVGCYVCNKWLVFSNFKLWMKTQDWQDKVIDKDILGTGKLYSPKTCCFVEVWLNNLFAKPDATGVWFDKKRGKFRAAANWGGRSVFLGRYETEKEAINAYRLARRERITKKIADYPNQRIKEGVLRKVGA